MKLQVSPILKYIAEGEHQQQDFKFCINDSRKIARTLVAFANTDGGRLLIGVKDNGRIAGVRSDEEYYMVEAAARLYSKPIIDFESEVWDVDGKMVLEINIKTGDKKPYLAQDESGKWFAYLRVNDENILANAVLVKAWKLRRKTEGIKISMDEPTLILIDYLKTNQQISLSKLMRITHTTRNHAQDMLSELMAIDCVKMVMQGKVFVYQLNEFFDLDSIEQLKPTNVLFVKRKHKYKTE